FESWSMDVPTFVNRYTVHPDFGAPVSAAPYLGPDTGAFWEKPEELVALLSDVSAYRPREWILKHGTDAVSAMAFQKLVGL
ncbi:MAG TPA: hypothetical protein VHA07_00025, partial [Devosia sp.]|nr:hypothetical protein [Devosia sp.]